MLGLVLELAQIGVSVTKWVIVSGYQGGRYLIYGQQKDPVLEKLEAIEMKLDSQNMIQQTNDQSSDLAISDLAISDLAISDLAISELPMVDDSVNGESIKNSDNLTFYQNLRENNPELIPPNTWLVISEKQVVCDSVHKSQALMSLAHLADMGDQEALLVYVNQAGEDKIYQFD